METLWWVVLASATTAGALMVLAVSMKQLLYICEPNEVLVFSGRTQVTPDGRRVGFRVIEGGRAFRIPIVERVDRMDVSLISVPMVVRNAYSEGGIPLTVQAIANVKVSSDPAVIGNAIERFLGHSRVDIARVAKETLEGHLRGVLATMTPEKVNEDRLEFADRLEAEAGSDLRKLGLQVDTLKIQHVSDERHYLDSIGRKRIAEIVRDAEVAESDAVRAAEEAESHALARGGVAKSRATAVVQSKANEVRQVQAQLEASAKSEEERAEAAAHAARAEAEKELQGIRADLEQLRLQADVIIPAEIEQRVAELVAAGEAAAIAENGKAIARSLDAIAAVWQEHGRAGMDAVVVQQLDAIFAKVTEAAAASHAREVTVLDAGDGAAVAGWVSAYPKTVAALLEQIRLTLGVDVGGVLRGREKTNGKDKGEERWQRSW